MSLDFDPFALVFPAQVTKQTAITEAARQIDLTILIFPFACHRRSSSSLCRVSRRRGQLGPRANQYSVSETGILSGGMIEPVCPSVDDRIVIEVIDGGDQPILRFLLGGNPDMSQHRAGKFREEAVDQIEPGAVLGCECAVTAREVIMK
jgi:hypothetical protein